MAAKNGFDKLTNLDEKWMSNYEAPKYWTLEHGHFPNCAKEMEFRHLGNHLQPTFDPLSIRRLAIKDY